jgi:hypothetical protein
VLDVFYNCNYCFDFNSSRHIIAPFLFYIEDNDVRFYS